MIFSLIGVYSWWHNRKIFGAISLFISWFIKGMTIVLLPLFFLQKKSWDQILAVSYWLVLIVFILFAPLREELYPWYAVWFISIAAYMKFDRELFVYWLTIVISIALELRHLPYIWMGYYEGPGPMLRLLVTVVPVALFIPVFLFAKYKHNLQFKS